MATAGKTVNKKWERFLRAFSSEPETVSGDYTEPETVSGDYTEPETVSRDYTEPETVSEVTLMQEMTHERGDITIKLVLKRIDVKAGTT